MSEASDLLAARKQLLLARSRLHRLELQVGVRSLRRSLLTPSGAFSIAASAPVRPLLFTALTFALGSNRLARMLRGALGVLAVVKIAHTAYGWVGRSAGPDPRDDSEDLSSG